MCIKYTKEVILEKEILENLKKISHEIEVKNQNYQSNKKRLDKLKNNKMVSEAIDIVDENNRIEKEINACKNRINSLMNRCKHSLLLYKDYSCQIYDSYYSYQCIECGEIIESSFKMNNVIKSDISYNELKNEYYRYLFKYDEVMAIEIMLAKYNSKMFSTMVKEGLEEVRVLKLIKNMESDGSFK